MRGGTSDSGHVGDLQGAFPDEKSLLPGIIRREFVGATGIVAL